MKVEPLETARLVLRPSAYSLAQETAAYYRRNGAWLQSFDPAYPPGFCTVAGQKEMMRHDRLMAKTGLGCRFWLCPRDTPGTVIGTVSLGTIVRGAFRSCFIGYKLDQDFLRQGYMSEAVDRVAEYAFSALRLHRIEANIMPRNLPSLATARKCGFTEEGVARKYLQINGVWEDHIHMVRLNPDPMEFE